MKMGILNGMSGISNRIYQVPDTVAAVLHCMFFHPQHQFMECVRAMLGGLGGG